MYLPGNTNGEELVAGLNIEVERYATFVHIHDMLRFQIELSILCSFYRDQIEFCF